MQQQWNKFPAPNTLRSKVLTSPYRSLTLPDGTDAWQRVDDGFVFEHTPFECVPRDVAFPDDRTGIWEEKANEYDALDAFEPTDDPLLAPPPLYDHQDVVIEEEVKKEGDPRRVKFADQLEDFEPAGSGVDDQWGIPHSIIDRDVSGETHRVPAVLHPPAHKYRTRRQCPNINTVVDMGNFHHVDMLEEIVQ
eukprot:3270205-Amphidinium_carterae.1